MKRLALLIALVGSCALLAGAGGSTYKGATYRGGSFAVTAGSYAGAVPAAAETTRILVRDATLPNTAAEDSGYVLPDSAYDTIIEDTDGSHIRYTCVLSSSPTATYHNINGLNTSRYVERNQDTGIALHQLYLWFDTSEIRAGSKVTASISLNAWRWGGMDFSTGYIAARADTADADYAMLNAAPVVADPSSMNTSWNEVDVTNTVAWTPTLTARDDLHQYGPRGEPLYPGGTVGASHAIEIDVSAAVQAVVDNGDQARGIIFVVYTVGTPTAVNSWMMGNDLARAPTGNPCLEITAVSKRGQKAWGGKVPVNIVFDDNYTDEVPLKAVMDSVGFDFSTASYRDSWDAIADSMWGATGGDGFDFIVHSKQHTILGSLTDAQVRSEVARDWIPGTVTDPPDTSRLVNFAWVGGASPKYSMAGVRIMIRNGYRTCRATQYYDTDTPIGTLTFAAWDQYVNLFAVQSRFATTTDIWGASTEDELRERLLDYVDLCWTDRGRAAALYYTHGQANGCTPQKLRWFVKAINDYDFLNYRTHGWVMAQLAARPWVNPANVTEANGATAEIAAAAARYDTTASETWTDSVWVGPK